MSRIIARHCPHCHEYAQLEWTGQIQLECPSCHKAWGTVHKADDMFDRCPMCPCRQFYLSKNFNQFLGCTIMLAGIVLVPWTYGLSLPVFAGVDWLLHKRVPFILNCYRCGCEFHGFDSEHSRFKPFLHHIGLKYDKYR